MTGPQLRRLAAAFDKAGQHDQARNCRNRAAMRELGVASALEFVKESPAVRNENGVPLMPMGGAKRKPTRSIV